MKLLCLIGIHNNEFMQETVVKTKTVRINNVWDKCKRCGKESEKEGLTTFGPIKFSIVSSEKE